MSNLTVHLEPQTEKLYQRVADSAGLSLEQVLSDALFKLAGELALESLSRGNLSDTVR